MLLAVSQQLAAQAPCQIHHLPTRSLARRSARYQAGPCQAHIQDACTLRQQRCRRVAMHATQPTQSSGSKPTGVLFVCLGNICRSPSAEAVFKSVVERRGLAHQFVIDSCGTGGGHPDWYKKGGFAYHEGDRPDERMTETAETRGIKLTSRSRPLRPQDMTDFDYIIGMDFQNITAIQLAADYWQDHSSIPPDYRRKVRIMGSFMPESSKYKGVLEVPDPWFDDDAERRGFYRVLDLLDDACEGLLDSILAAPES